MKRLHIAKICLFIGCALFLCGCRESEAVLETEVASETNIQETVQTLRILQYKVEIIEPLEGLIETYEATHPGVNIELESIGGGVDYPGMLRYRFAAGEYPDILNCNGDSELDSWESELLDLSDQPWVGRAIDKTLDAITKDGKVYGMPYNIEGYGVIYNKALFGKAGITKLPATLDELEQVCEQLEAAGIQPFVNGYQEWWVTGNHGFNAVLASRDDPDAFINGLRNGNRHLIQDGVANRYVRFLDLTLRYGQEASWTTDYSSQVTSFANGEAAMMQQGNWIQVQLTQIDPNLKMGILPIPIAAGVNDSIPVGVPSYWSVYKNSPVQALAKDFLNWMVASEEGQACLVDEFQFIPAFNDIAFTEDQLGELAVAVRSYQRRGKTLGWHWKKMPDGASNEIGAITQKYLSGRFTKEEMFDAIEKLIREM